MIRVLVAAENELLRAALTALLARERDLAVVAEAAHWDDVVPVAVWADPDVALIDLDLDGRDGLPAAIRLLRDGFPTLILASANRHTALARLAATEARDIGFLSVSAPPDEVIGAVRDLARGEPVIDPEIAMLALTAPDSPLTERETDVLGRVADGAPATEIADELGLAVSTVRNHLSRINGKIGARTRIEAVKVATNAGWL